MILIWLNQIFPVALFVARTALIQPTVSETKFLFQKYASSLAEEESFEIVHADGEKIMLEMSNKISKVFDKNIAALKVRPLVVRLG